MIGICHANRSVVSLARRCYLKLSGQNFPVYRTSCHFKCIRFRKRRHKSYFVYAFPVIESVHGHCLMFSGKGSVNFIIYKWIFVGMTVCGHFQNIPFFHLFFIIVSSHILPLLFKFMFILFIFCLYFKPFHFYFQLFL